MFSAFQKGEVLGQRSGGGATIPNIVVNDMGAAGIAGTAKSIIYEDPVVAKKDSVSSGLVEIHIPSAPTNAPKDTRYKVMLCGTYPVGQSNGYSRVVYYIAKYLGAKTDIKLTIYGFQNYNQTAGVEQRSDIPSSVTLHDALATEVPRRNGFGEKEIVQYVRANPQDMIVIFNDMVITTALTSNLIQELSPDERSRIKLVSYMDQVYPFQKKNYIQLLNTYFDAVITFTPYWRKVVRTLGLKPEIPCYVFPHGFDHTLYYPVSRKTARAFYNIPDDAFVVLQLNRNQPRKRMDIMMIAFAKVLARLHRSKQENPDKKWKPLRLMIGTMIDGAWDLLELLDHELMLLGVPAIFGRESVIAISRPQQLSDRDINIMYNACDIGLNTCEGEGWGLCQSEHAAVGCPQIAARIGGMQEFLNDGNSILLEPKWRYYIDKSRDGIGGIAEIADANDFAEAIWKYYTNPKLVSMHGSKARKEILQHYRWETVVNHFHRVIYNIAGKTIPDSAPSS